MARRVQGRWFLAALLLAPGFLGGAPAVFDQSHAKFAKVLNAHTRDGLVDYAALKKNPANLEAYLQEVASVNEDQFNAWTREQKVAFLINAYNAAVLQLVASHYPVKSIKRIGGFFGSPFRIRTVDLFGEKISLDDLEHGLLRPQFKEPRVHFALVCAARSCPILRAEPYRAEKLNEQLSEQGRLFLNNSAKNRVDPESGVIHLSPIFKWFSEDFTAGGRSIVEFVRPYFSAPLAEALGRRPYKVRWMDYDWSLNDTASKK